MQWHVGQHPVRIVPRRGLSCLAGRRRVGDVCSFRPTCRGSRLSFRQRSGRRSRRRRTSFFRLLRGFLRGAFWLLWGSFLLLKNVVALELVVSKTSRTNYLE